MLRPATFGDASAELHARAQRRARSAREAANQQRAPDPWDDLDAAGGPRSRRSSTRTSAAGRRAAVAAAVAARPAGHRAVPQLDAAGRGRLAGRRPGAIREPGSQQLGRERPAAPPRASPSSPTIRIATVTNPSLRYIVHLVRAGLERHRRGRAAVCRRRARSQRARRVGPDDRRHRSGRRLRRGSESGEPERSEVARRVGAAAGRARRDQGEGQAPRDRRAEVQPARADLLRGHARGIAPTRCDRRCSSRARRRTSAACASRRRATAASSSTRRCTGRRRPRT